MAAPATNLTQDQALIAELEAFAAPYLSAREFASTADVLHAALAALQREKDAEDRILTELADEGEASGIAEGDVIGRVRLKHGLPPSKFFR